MTYKELYNICHDEAVAYANTEQWSKRTGEQKSFLIQGYLDAMMEVRKSEITDKKKKDYPKTYEECCVALEYIPHTDDIIGYKWDILQSLQKLLICRDAYWKIAGEEIGLDKPWEPDWDDDEWPDMYYISWSGKYLDKEKGYPCCNMILIFPTEEMRDAFKENFDPDIEICKELL